mgnify:FL=1
MERITHMETERLTLSEVSLNDTDFIFDLLNTPQWIKYIGDKNIQTKNDAAAYIQKTKENTAANYWVVKLKEDHTPLGIVTFMKRDYLDHHDIGFAFLPQYGKKGYAFEASKKLLDEVSSQHKVIVATVLPDNPNSIQLIQKLGLQFEKEIDVNDEHVLLYSILTGK